MQSLSLPFFLSPPPPANANTKRSIPRFLCSTPPKTHTLTIGTSRSAAFLLTPDTALTCHHATSNSEDAPFHISSTSATLTAHSFEADIALLHLSRPLPCTPPTFDPAPPLGCKLYSRMNHQSLHFQLLSVAPALISHSASRIPMLLLRAIPSSSSEHAVVQPGWSGAPVFTKTGAVAGMIVQSRGDLAHAVPCFLFNLLRDGPLRIGYIPCLRVQQLLSRAARRAVQHDGVRVIEDVGSLRKDDVLLQVAGYTVRNDATVDFQGLISHFQTPLAALQPGTEVALSVFRDGHVVSLKEKLRSACDASSVPVCMAARVVYMGNFIFTELSWEYLRAWGDDWETRCPPALLAAARAERRDADGEIVVLTSVANLDGGDSVQAVLQELHERVVRVDGKHVHRLEDLLDRGKEQFLVELENGHVLVLPPGRLERADFQNQELDTAGFL